MAKPFYSTATAEQHNRIIERLRISPATTAQLREIGCFCPASRIIELREYGYRIETQRRDIVDAHGYPHRRMGLYILHSEPDPSTDVEGA